MRNGEFVNVVPRPWIGNAGAGTGALDIYCAPATTVWERPGHGGAWRGFPQPPRCTLDRLREAKPGYVFDVITRGFGWQPDMAAQIPVADRWAIVAYMKVLCSTPSTRP
jgi:hypothetical protein